MTPKRKTWLYALTDSETNDNIYYVDGGVVKKQPYGAFINSPFLPQNPIGWKEISIDFGTSEKYKSLNRSFNIGLTFIGDGAEIIRSRQYFGRGSEETMYLVILRWNREDDTYYLEYNGKLDLSTGEDDVNGGRKINTIEGGLLSYLTANDSNPYEIVCDESNPLVKQVYLDGMNLSETLNYSFFEIDYNFINNVDNEPIKYILPETFVNNEGDHEDVLYGNPTYEIIPDDDFYSDSSNYLIKNIGVNNIDFTLKGDLVIDAIDTIGEAGNLEVRYVIANDASFISDTLLLSTPFPQATIKTIPFSINVTLQPNQKLFIYFRGVFTAPEVGKGGFVFFNQSAFKIGFISRKSPSNSFCLSLYDYYKLLVLKLTDGKYTGESLYLKGRTDLVITCGDALRNTDRTVIPHYLISMSFEELFQSIPCDDSGVGLQVRAGVLYLEELSDIYADNATIYDLGEVSGLKIKPATSIICNTVKAGYPDQTYDTNGGKYEVNSEQTRQMPVLSQKRVFDVSSKARADARGIEQIRAEYTHLDSTDNAGDKQPFFLQISQQVLNESYTAQTSGTPASYTGQQWVVFDGAIAGNYMSTDANKYIFTFNGNFQRADIYVYLYINNSGHKVQVVLFKNGQSIAIYTGNDTDGVTPIVLHVTDGIILNDNYEIQITPFDAGFDTYTVVATLYFDFLIKPYLLLRLPYTSITGVLDNTIFNVELRPLNQILGHGNELHEILAQQDAFDITLISGKKNTSLVTALNGVTKDEAAPIPVASLPLPLGLPYDFEFTTQVPYTFTDILQMARTGLFRITCNGVQFILQSRGSLKSTPATNAAQIWTLRASVLNLFSDFFRVSDNETINFTFNNNMIANSIYSPLHLIRYGFTPQSKYHHKDMYEDWSYQRFDSWGWTGTNNAYRQQWQTNDTICIPLLSAGLGQLSVFVYDRNGDLYNSQLMTVISTPFVKLPYILQQYNLNIPDEGYYLVVIKSGTDNVFVSEWLELRDDLPNTYLINYSNSKNQLNLPWLAYTGQLSLRVDALFEQWEPDSEAVDYEDDSGDFSVLSGTPLQKRNLIIGATVKQPEWMGLKVNAILLKDRVFIEGTGEDKHYTRRASTQMAVTKYQGNPLMRFDIEVIPATNQEFLVSEDLPIEDVSGWHATIDAQVFGLDEGSTEIEITNE